MAILPLNVVWNEYDELVRCGYNGTQHTSVFSNLKSDQIIGVLEFICRENTPKNLLTDKENVC